MRNAIIVFSLGFIIMAVGIAYALIQGNFFDELEIMRPLPWFHLSMLDLYIGFFLFSGWIIFREKTLILAIVWIVLLLSLGNLIACLYAVVALVRSRGNWQIFWMGACTT
ncbi:MAG: DUF1475 family protein [Phycisphaerales bacterium]|nr:DUF1475 family protein [Phycisphaerales bacterium]